MPELQQLPSTRPAQQPPAAGKPTDPQYSEGYPAGVPESERQIYTEEELEQQQEQATSFVTQSDEQAGPPPPPPPNISNPIAWLLVAYSAILDTIGVVIVFFGLDDFFILDTAGAVINSYFFIKGIKATYSTITTLLELIPYLGALPLKTFGVISMIWIDRHPKSKAAQALNVASKKVPGKK